MSVDVQIGALERKAKRRARYLTAKEKAKASRRELVRALGGRCVECGDAYMGNLEIDHVDGRDWVIREPSYPDRIARYWREYRAGVRLAVRCRRCNGKRNQHDPAVIGGLARRKKA